MVKTTRILLLALLGGLICPVMAEEKKAEKFDAEKLKGTWALSTGKINGKDVSEDGKKGTYTITKDKITLAADGKTMFVFGYTLDDKSTPVAVNMEIKESVIEGAKGSKALGIVELSGDDLKITYTTSGDRPNKFEDDKAYAFVLKKQKGEKK